MSYLAEHDDGYVYIVHEDVDSSKPVKYISWWSLGMKAYQYKRNYGEDRIGQKMYKGHFSGEYIGEDKLKYRLINGGQTIATYTYQEEIPMPKSRLELRWSNGQWLKKTAKGWKSL